MFCRQFINLVMRDFRVEGSYWLSRMRPEQKLFYPSAAEAITAQAQTKKETPMMPYRTTLDLPRPAVRFKSSRTACLALDFMPFYRRGGDEGKIVAVDLAGQTVLYDAKDDSIEMLPQLHASRWRSPISLCVTNPNASGAHHLDALYAINRSYSSEFQALVQGNPYGFNRSANKVWHWLSLPPPPYLDHPACDDHTIQSYTLLQDGNTICFSSVPLPHEGGFGTYCFDTSNNQWAKASGWVLPFHGRAVHIPGLHGLWFGIGDDQHELRAVDLSSSLTDGAPKVLHRWRCSDPPDHWLLIGSTMVDLGANRFCVARNFGVYNEPRRHFEQLTQTAAILTGVEVLNGEGNKAKLTMVEHKSRTYIFTRCGIEAVL